MRTRSNVRNCLFRVLPVATSLLLLPVHEAASQGCLLAPAKLSDSAMQAFKERPAEFLDRHATGGPLMSADIMRRVGSDMAALPVAVQLARDGNQAQRVAIGIGLAKASATCSRTHPGLEQMIKQAVAEAAISELTVSFAAGLSSLELTAAPIAGTQPAGAPLAGDLRAAGGGSLDRPAGAGGGVAAVVVGTEFLKFAVNGSTLSVRRGGEPVMSLRSKTAPPPADTGGDPGTPPRGDPKIPPDRNGDGTSPPDRNALTFLSRGVRSTYGNTVSPTRR